MKSSIIFMLKNSRSKNWIAFGYLTLLLESITPIIAIILQKDLIDSVFLNKQYDYFPIILGLYAIFFFSLKLWFTVRRVIFSHIAYDIQENLTRKFIYKVYSLPEEIASKEHSGKLLNNIRNDISDATEVAVNQLLSDGIKSIMTIIFLSVSLAYININLFIVVVIVAIIYYILLHIFSKKTKQYSQNVRREKSKVSVSIEENVSSVREVVAFGREKWQINKFKESFKVYFRAIIREGFYKAKTIVVSEPFLYGTKLSVIIIGGFNVISNNISLGEFVVSFNLVDQMVTELGQIFQQALTGKRLKATADCIKSVLDQPCREFGNKNFTDSVENIQFKNVTFRYNKKSEPVLSNLSLEFPVGKKIAIVGESGSGKSTITKLLLRDYSPDAGEVLINNIPVNNYNLQYLDKISAVFQEPYFLPSSIKENIIFDKVYEYEEIEKVCKDMQCYGFINEFPQKYETVVGERGAKLSGGQKQRIALTRAVLRDTDILVLDEATAALDIKTEYDVQNNLDRLRKGKTTIIIAHRISTIQNADIIFVMDNGKVIAKGTHYELIENNSVYKELYEHQRIC
ncbi:ABC transporter ATP-binding protein [Clostridiaceae bacterium M8S5]|nr:ABC transporter ATP-binding protein [Clostridiaceae bacterium M8S5]